MANDDEPIDVPARYSRVDPWVISSDTDAEIAFLTTVFEGKETPGSRILGPDGRIGHVEVELGDAVIMLFDAEPDWPSTPGHLRIYVANTQDTFDRALVAGARAVTRPTDLAFGERVARVRDPQGHLWWIHQHLEDVAVEDLAERFADPSTQQAMSYVQQSLVSEMSGARPARPTHTREMTRATLYERIGSEKILALARAWHDRATADEVVGHAFSHGFDPDHVRRVAAYWAQAWGGPSVYTDTMGDESGMVRMHSGDGEHDEMDQRAEACFMAAADDVGLPQDTRAELLAYWRWATVHVNAYPDSDLDVPDGIRFATWINTKSD